MVVHSYESAKGRATVVESVYIEGGPHPNRGPVGAAFNVATRKVVWHMAETTERAVRMFTKRSRTHFDDHSDAASDTSSEPETPSSPLSDLGPFGAASRSPQTLRGKALRIVPKRIRTMIQRSVWRKKKRFGNAMRMLMVVSLMTRGKPSPMVHSSSTSNLFSLMSS